MNNELAFGARTTRSNNFVGIIKPSGTGDLPTVGPGAYEAPSSLRVDKPAPDAITSAAFGSSSERKFIVPGDTGVTVGPGSYDVNSAYDSIHAGNSASPHMSQPPIQMSVSETEEMTARTEALRVARGGSLYERKQRNNDAKRPTPGPGQYHVTDNHWGNGHGAVAMQTVFGVDAVMAKSRQVGLPGSSVTWMRLPTAPTIPGRSQGFGYEEGLNGELIMMKDKSKRYTGGVGDVPGPGEYTPQLPTRNSRTINFGRGSLRPEIVRVKPKPNKVNLFGSSQVAIDEEDRFMPSPPKPSSMFLSSERKSPSVQSKSSVTPGPGSYNKPSTLNVKPKAPEQLQFFGSTVQRFSGPRNVVSFAGAPGPGSYGDVASSFNKVKKASRSNYGPSADRVAFQSSSNRSDLGVPSDKCDVGPGQYTLPGMTDEIIRKQKRQNYVRKDDFDARRSQSITIPVSSASMAGGLQHIAGESGEGGYASDDNLTLGPVVYFSNCDGSPIKRKGSGKVRTSKGDGARGMMKGTVLRAEEPEPRPSSSFQNTGRRDPQATHLARLAASGSQLGHGVDYTNRNDANGINRKGPLTETERSRVFTSNPVLALREPHHFQLAQGFLPTAKGPDLMRSTGRGEGGYKISETSIAVGPGSYEVGGSPASQSKHRSSRGVMDSKDRRLKSFDVNPQSLGPGPGEYDVTRSKGSMVLPTFNAAIAESVRY